MESYWEIVSGGDLWQGDLLHQCKVPKIPPGFPDVGQEPQLIHLDQYDLIIATPTCDIEQKKVKIITLCPVWAVEKFEKENPSIKSKWNDVLKGRLEGLHLLSSPEDPSNNRVALVVDFHVIFSLPLEYLVHRAEALGNRPRLRSPWVEDFSQAFGRYFMRIALPSRVPIFK